MQEAPKKHTTIAPGFKKPGVGRDSVGLDPLARLGEWVNRALACSEDGALKTAAIESQVARSYEELVEKLFDAIYGEGAAKENPDLFLKFKSEVDEVLANLSEDNKRELVALFIEEFLKSDSLIFSCHEAEVKPNLSPLEMEGPGPIASLKRSLSSLGSFGVLVLGAALTGGESSKAPKRSDNGKTAVKHDEKLAMVVASEEVGVSENNSGKAKLSLAVDELLEGLHRKYRETIIESLQSLAEEKARQERNRLIGVFAEDSTESAQKAKRLADTELVLEEARVVLSAFRGTDMHTKMELIAERLKQIHYINRALQPKARLWDVVEAADAGGFSVLS